MGRSDIFWANRVKSSAGGAVFALALGEPDAQAFVMGEGRSVTLADFQRASYQDLPRLFATPIAGDVVTPNLLGQADVIAFELNGRGPAPSGGWESCDWEFTDGPHSLQVHWDEAAVTGAPGAAPVPRDPHIVANGSISGTAYGAFFGIPTSTLVQGQGTTNPDEIVISFLLFRVRPEIDVRSPSFSISIVGVPGEPGIREATPDPDAVGVLVAFADAETAKPRKPKKSIARRTQSLCDSLRVTDAVLPMLAAIWTRRESGQPARNDFEGDIYTVFERQNAAQHDAMAFAFNGYKTLRDSGLGACLYDNRIGDDLANRPLNKAEFVDEFVREGAFVAWQQLFEGSGGQIGPGQVRIWRPEGIHGPDATGPFSVSEGPHPWLTAIRPDHSSEQEFGNMESFIPIPPNQYFPLDYQFDQVCSFSADTFGQITANCERVHLPPGPPGGFGGGSCLGGPAYNFGNDCLRIPAQRAGGNISLRGFNFITPEVTVHLFCLTDPNFPEFVKKYPVFGDRETPVNDAQGKVIVDMRVKDWVDVALPGKDDMGRPFPAGLYDIWVTVAEPVEGGAPILRDTNKLKLKIEPGGSIPFFLRSERGKCIRETPGMGDDEIWWDAFVSHFVPNKVPISPVGPTPVKLQDTIHVQFPRSPWEDMDDGETAAHTVNLFGPGQLEVEGLVVVAVVGFEVDSEALAREQLQGFWNAYLEALKSIAVVALGLGGAATGVANLASKAGVKISETAFTAFAIGAAVAAAVVLVSAALWAWWAPADLIALDMFFFDPLNAFDFTDPKRPLPPPSKRRFGANDVAVRVTQRALPKIGAATESSVTWVQENQYDTDDSSYVLEFRLSRRGI